jgi:multiple sugar transport system substrate-binding protein
MTSGRGVLSRRAVLVAAAGIAAGCAGRAGTGTRAGLVWVTGGISSADRGPAEDIADQWNAGHPRGPQVQVQALPESASQQRQLLEVELDAGLANIDIFDLDSAYTAEFAQRGWLVDLQDLRSDFEPLSLPVALRTAEWGGTLWAAPYVVDLGLLYYRSDLVREPPATWEEMLAAGRRAGKQPGIAPFVADGAQYEGLVVQYLEHFWGRGGAIFDADGRTVLFPLDKARQAAEFMRTSFLQGDYAPGFDTMKLEDARSTFQAGEAVFMRSWPYAYKPLNSSEIAGKVGIAPLPAVAGHQPVTALGGHNLAVSAFSRNIDAATEFARFVSTTPQVQRRLAQAHSLAPTMATTYHELAGDPMMAMLGRVLPTAKQRPATPQWATISAEIQQRIFAAYTGTVDPAAAVEAVRTFLVATEQDN